MERRPDVYLELAVDALAKVERFLGDRSERAYLADDLVQSAVERQLEVAGDALAQLRRDFPDVFARVPDGPTVIAFRNILAHGYATLDPPRVRGGFASGRQSAGRSRDAAGRIPRASVKRSGVY